MTSNERFAVEAFHFTSRAGEITLRLIAKGLNLDKNAKVFGQRSKTDHYSSWFDEMAVI